MPIVSNRPAVLLRNHGFDLVCATTERQKIEIEQVLQSRNCLYRPINRFYHNGWRVYGFVFRGELPELTLMLLKYNEDIVLFTGSNVVQELQKGPRCNLPKRSHAV